MRRLAISCLLFAPACGLAFAPGDYREPSDALPPGAGGPDGSSTTEGGSTVDASPEAGDAGPSRTRVALFAGRRDAVPGETGGQVTIAETMRTWVGDDGSLGPITYDAPPPTNTPWLRAALGEGVLRLHNAGVLVTAPFSDHVGGPWTVAAIPGPPQPGIRPWLVDPHALLSGRSLAGNDQAWSVPLGDGGAGGWINLGAKTKVVRGNTTLVRAGGNVYLVGGETAGTDQVPGVTAHTEVEVATLSATGEPADFHVTEPLPTSGGIAHTVFQPITVASADHLFLVGGSTAPSASALTNQACAAKIKDAATGDLAPFEFLPALPVPMTEFALVVTPSWLVAFGGQLADGRTSATVLRLALHADGTYGSAWEPAGQLPAGRSGIVGVTY